MIWHIFRFSRFFGRFFDRSGIINTPYIRNPDIFELLITFRGMVALPNELLSDATRPLSGSKYSKSSNASNSVQYRLWKVWRYSMPIFSSSIQVYNTYFCPFLFVKFNNIYRMYVATFNNFKYIFLLETTSSWFPGDSLLLNIDFN